MDAALVKEFVTNATGGDNDGVKYINAFSTSFTPTEKAGTSSPLYDPAAPRNQPSGEFLKAGAGIACSRVSKTTVDKQQAADSISNSNRYRNHEPEKGARRTQSRMCNDLYFLEHLVCHELKALCGRMSRKDRRHLSTFTIV